MRSSMRCGRSASTTSTCRRARRASGPRSGNRDFRRNIRSAIERRDVDSVVLRLQVTTGEITMWRSISIATAVMALSAPALALADDDDGNGKLKAEPFVFIGAAGDC